MDHLILLNYGIELIEVEHCKKKKKIVENENTRGEIEAKQSSINILFIESGVMGRSLLALIQSGLIFMNPYGKDRSTGRCSEWYFH